jgi:K+-transporting ATPase ATPase B chain
MPGVASAPEAVAVDGGIRGSGGIDDGVKRQSSLFDRKVLARATLDAVAKFDPRVQVRNPVMFVVLVGTVVTLVESVAHPSIFAWSVTIWLALTVMFANFAEAVAEGRGKAQAAALRRMRSDTEARRLGPDGAEGRVPAAALAKGDLVVCEAGDIIPSDGEITLLTRLPAQPLPDARSAL